MSPQAQYPINIQQLRQTLKIKWLTYYQQNYHWLIKMQIWSDYNGDRRPMSGFILATVAVLEPNLNQILPFIADLNSNPDQVIAALGLDFNPDQHLHLIEKAKSENLSQHNQVNTTPNPSSIPTACLEQPLTNGHASVTRILSHPSDNHTHHGNSNGNGNGNGKNGGNGGNGGNSGNNLANPIDLKSGYTAVSLPNLQQQHPTTPIVFKESFPPANAIAQTINQPIPNEVNQSSILSPRNLANWIDDFCQGADWNPDEAVFIPF